MEAEKFLFDLKHNCPSEGVFNYIDALTDFESIPSSLRHITNEFVLNVAEIVTDPSESPIKIIEDYILNYLLLNSISRREDVVTVSLGALPLNYQPHMSPKWPHLVQNIILTQNSEPIWKLNKDSPLTCAGNCAGIHVHAEMDTPPEFLFATRELQDKFNMGLMLTPLIAFSSSPYFFGKHRASSMRGAEYFCGVYKDFPLNGGLPPVMNSSAEVLNFFKESTQAWVSSGVSAGLKESDLLKLTYRKGASWNPIRWNRAWNTLEFRGLDSDRVDYDCSKFIWVVGAMRRLDLKGEALQCLPLTATDGLDEEMIDNCLVVNDNVVTILPTHALKELFMRSINFGVKDPLVKRYLKRFSEFARKTLNSEELVFFEILEKVLKDGTTTSEKILEKEDHKKSLKKTEAIDIIRESVEDERIMLQDFIQHFPDTSHEWSRLIR